MGTNKPDNEPDRQLLVELVDYYDKELPKQRFYMSDTVADDIRACASNLSEKSSPEMRFAKRRGYFMMAQDGTAFYSLKYLEATPENMLTAIQILGNPNRYKDKGFVMIPSSYSEDITDLSEVLRIMRMNHIRGNLTEYIKILPEESIIYTLIKRRNKEHGLANMSRLICPIEEISAEKRNFLEKEKYGLESLLEETKTVLQQNRGAQQAVLNTASSYGIDIAGLFFLQPLLAHHANL